jgi:uncharacterized damage-inducible protein DinB
MENVRQTLLHILRASDEQYLTLLKGNLLIKTQGNTGSETQN